MGFLGAAFVDASIRSLPRAGGDGSSTDTTWYWSSTRTGAKGTGRFGGVAKHDYKNLHCKNCLAGVARQRGVYDPVANGGIVDVELSIGNAWGQAAVAMGTLFKQRPHRSGGRAHA